MPTKQELVNKLVEIDSGDYAASHYERFVQSYYTIAPFIKDGMKIVDIGSYGHFQKLVQAFHPNVEFPTERTDFDLRYPFPIDSEKYDMVFCMEVIEHIKDQNEEGDIEKLAEFSQSGVKNLMTEIRRILKPNGIFFLTTPNINSYMSIHRALNYYSPTFYLPHVKEWSIQEMHELHRNHSFEVGLATTEDVFAFRQLPRQRIRSLCHENGYGTDLRGDIMLFVSTKKATD